MAELTMLDVFPTIVGFRAMQVINRRWIQIVTTGGGVHDEVLGYATDVILQEVIPYVPILTGTLSAAQQALLEEGEPVAYITTMHLQNPLFGSFADEYAPDVLEYIDFYGEGVAAAQYLLEAEIYGVIETELLR